MPKKILDPTKSYSFTHYFGLPDSPYKIFSELGFSFSRSGLNLPKFSEDLPLLPALEQTISMNFQTFPLNSETARREALVSPILGYICHNYHFNLNVEYPINFNRQLKGKVDYLLQHKATLIVIEAKKADLVGGFNQLAAEMIAASGVYDRDLIYGAVTIGDQWRFGFLDRRAATIVEDTKLYLVPENLEDLCRVLIGILKS
jgi:hypothetical protein